MLARIALAVMLVSCRRTPDTARPDPTPPVDAARLVTISPGLTLLHGRIVDVRDGRVVHVLREKKPIAEAMDAGAAFTLDKDDHLRAWDPATGKLRWEIAKSGFTLRVGSKYLFVTDATSVEAFNRTDGTRLWWSGATGRLGEIELAGGRPVRRDDAPNLGFLDDLGAKPSWTTHAFTGAIAALLEDHTRALAVRDDGVCYVVFEPPADRVECVGLDGKLKASTRVPLSRPGDPSGTRFLPRFLSRTHIVIGTFSFGGPSSPRRAAVVRLSDGNVTVLDEEVAAAVERPDGTLEGLLVTKPELKLVSPTGALRWMEKHPRTDGFAAVALIDDRLVIAIYNAIATGVDVFAVRVSDGKPLWTGETKLPPIAHSKYHNSVTLETLGDAVILRGDESSVDHVHVYDSKTGALRFSDAQ